MSPKLPFFQVPVSRTLRLVPAAVRSLALTVALACPLIGYAQTTWYVDGDAPRGGDGTSWPTAYHYMQDALAAAISGDEVRVSSGAYRPDQDETGSAIPGNRAATFRIPEGVTVKGGYAGTNAPDPDDRDFTLYVTIFTGDLNGDDGMDGENHEENSYQTVTIERTGNSSTLEGVIVVGGGEGGTATDPGMLSHVPRLLTREARVVHRDGSYRTSKNARTSSPRASRTSASGVLFVDRNAAGPVHDGVSWCSGFSTLQDALAEASASGGQITEIRVANGVYNPDQDASAPDGSGDRDAVFQLLNAVALRGGYAGCGAADPDERNIELHETILSGDLADDDGPDFTNRADNSYGVLWAEDVDRTAVLDGFTVTSGYAPSNGGGSQSSAAGIFVIHADPTLIGCTFRDHWVNFGGSAIHAPTQGSMLVLNCRFMGNAGQVHGTVFTTNGHAAKLVNCSFLRNAPGTISGGGIGNAGGATPTLINCFFSGNVAIGNGAGVWNINNAHATLINCTLSGNSAGGEGGGVMSSAGASGPSNATVINSILWGNTDSTGNGEQAQIYTDTSTPFVDYCCVQGWTGAFGGVGNIGDDPRLIDPDGPDDMFGTMDDDAHLSIGSPAIDAADNTALPENVTTDLDGNPRFVDDPDTPDTGNPDGIHPMVDMGAYEFGPPDLCTDEDGDGSVTICHFPPGNPENAHTITVGVDAVPAHLAHGDYCGACQE